MRYGLFRGCWCKPHMRLITALLSSVVWDADSIHKCRRKLHAREHSRLWVPQVVRMYITASRCGRITTDHGRIVRRKYQDQDPLRANIHSRAAIPAEPASDIDRQQYCRYCSNISCTKILDHDQGIHYLDAHDEAKAQAQS